MIDADDSPQSCLAYKSVGGRQLATFPEPSMPGQTSFGGPRLPAHDRVERRFDRRILRVSLDCSAVDQGRCGFFPDLNSKMNQLISCVHMGSVVLYRRSFDMDVSFYVVCPVFHSCPFRSFYVFEGSRAIGKTAFRPGPAG